MKGSRPIWRQHGMAACLVITDILVGTAPSEARRVHRSIFYSETPFGSLAWVDDATTRAAAKSQFAVQDLTTESCMSLPSTGAQWFIVNHRDDDLEGQAGYFSIRVLYKFDSAELSADVRTGIHLQRNTNWFDTAGRQITQDYERSAEQIALTEDAFIQLHSPAPGEEDIRFAVITHPPCDVVHSLTPWGYGTH